jgi:two-component system, NarL family, sensor histidine kinase DesK
MNDREFRSGEFGLWARGSGNGGPRTVALLVWLGFIVFPLVDAIGNHAPLVHHILSIAGAAAFVALYAALVMTWWKLRTSWVPTILFALMVSVAVALTLADRSSWGFLFTYCAGCAALLPGSLAFASVVLSTVLAVGVSALGGAGGGTAISFGASTAGVGLLMMLLRDVRLRNIELSSARAELARLAVAEERERFSRDLHDLLGHSLSVIALKAELAGRMLPNRPHEAAGEIAELGQVARSALGEVRDAVSGYRQPTLDRELAGARMALSAAGIEAEVSKSSVALEPDVEAVLAWAVREGATNVIRHSGAHRCTLRVNASLTDAGVEVIDDGVGGALNGNGNGVGAGAVAGHVADAGGHGLAGLAERARPLNGTIEAGGLAGGGYRLAVTVPVARA